MWRYEIKFVLTDVDLAVFENWLMAQPHFRTAYPDRHVNSYYMDTPSMFTASDNLIGIPDRTKYRLRWYGESNEPTSRFEIKIKQGRLGRKETADIPVGHEEFLSMATSERERLLYSQESLRQHLPSTEPLLPVLGVSYVRNYFVRPGDIRVTIDRQLTFSELWSRHHESRKEKLAYPVNVIEFKFAPPEKDLVANIMSDLPFYPVRNSKYMLGLSKFGQSIYI